MKIKIGNLTINSRCVAYIDTSSDDFNFEDGGMPGVEIGMTSGKIFSFTGHKADEVRAILAQSEGEPSKRDMAAKKLEELGYTWDEEMWGYCLPPSLR
jgi:hypothetical protein